MNTAKNDHALARAGEKIGPYGNTVRLVEAPRRQRAPWAEIAREAINNFLLEHSRHARGRSG
ncbi:MAG: hypothetical protein OES46_21990 [Gammaproteobacteria bacterium]|nr:hypothetical protein [Gammaproteobacteria bacterium]